MTTLEEDIKERITRSGPITFATFMQLALYDRSRGYYGSGEIRTGWHGDFVTSPELDPAFGELWARGFKQMWVACGRPARFDIVELGGGEGSFASAVLQAVEPDFGRPLTYRIVERSPRVSERQRKALASDARVEWVGNVDELEPIACGCIVLNEVLDNMPVHVVEGREGDVVELYVGLEGDNLAFVAGGPSSEEVSAYLARHGLSVSDGGRVEVGIAAEQMTRRLATLIQGGGLVAIDYGDSSDRLAQRESGSLVSYSSGSVDDDVLDEPGSRDITSHVNWTAIASAMTDGGLSVTGPVTQREVLRSLGSAAIDAELRDRHRDAILKGDGATALQTLSRRQALGALTDPGGLGNLQVLVGARDCKPEFLKEG